MTRWRTGRTVASFKPERVTKLLRIIQSGTCSRWVKWPLAAVLSSLEQSTGLAFNKAMASSKTGSCFFFFPLIVTAPLRTVFCVLSFRLISFSRQLSSSVSFSDARLGVFEKAHHCRQLVERSRPALR